MADVIYKSNTCASCVVVENALAASPIPGVRVLNIDTDPTARRYFDEAVRLGAPRAVPLAVIDGRAVSGAHPILAALRAKYGRP